MRGEHILVPKDLRSFLREVARERVDAKRADWPDFDPQSFTQGHTDPSLEGYERTTYWGLVGETVVGYILGIPVRYRYGL